MQEKPPLFPPARPTTPAAAPPAPAAPAAPIFTRPTLYPPVPSEVPSSGPPAPAPVHVSTRSIAPARKRNTVSPTSSSIGVRHELPNKRPHHQPPSEHGFNSSDFSSYSSYSSSTASVLSASRAPSPSALPFSSSSASSWPPRLPLAEHRRVQRECSHNDIVLRIPRTFTCTREHAYFGLAVLCGWFLGWWFRGPQYVTLCDFPS